MPRAQLASKPNEDSQHDYDDDDDSYFVRKYQEVVNKGKERTQSKRSKLRADHAARIEALRARIKDAAPPPPRAVLTKDESTTARDQHPRYGSQLETLRHLLERKRDIEHRIAASVEKLEMVFNTASKELRAGFNARAAVAGEEIKLDEAVK